MNRGRAFIKLTEPWAGSQRAAAAETEPTGARRVSHVDTRPRLRYARRILVKNPLFTAIVVITLAIGIGLNTAVFSAIDTLLLRPLPGVRAPDQLVQVYRSWPGGVNYGSNSIPHYQDVRDRSSSVYSGVAAWGFVQASITTGGRPQTAFGMAVSANFFSVLGVTPLRGRTFVPDEATGPARTRWRAEL